MYTPTRTARSLRRASRIVAIVAILGCMAGPREEIPPDNPSKTESPWRCALSFFAKRQARDVRYAASFSSLAFPKALRSSSLTRGKFSMSPNAVCNAGKEPNSSRSLRAIFSEMLGMHMS